MTPITKAEGWKLIQEGKAGWYASNANPPIPHPANMVVYVGGNFYLATAAEIDLKQLGPVYITGLDGSKIPKMTWDVQVDSESELCKLIQQEIAAKGQNIDLGGVTGIYTGHPGKPQQNN